jgi:hypothetical protein
MQAILSVKLNEIDSSLIKIIRELLSKNAEIVIRKESLKFEEFDKSLPLQKVMDDFEKVGYSSEFLQDLREGLETSSLYKAKDENKTFER